MLFRSNKAGRCQGWWHTLHSAHCIVAPNSPLRDQVTALIPVTATDKPALASGSDETDAPDPVSRSPARYLWTTLIARLFELISLTCPRCGAEMKIIACVIEISLLPAILERLSFIGYLVPPFEPRSERIRKIRNAGRVLENPIEPRLENLLSRNAPNEHVWSFDHVSKGSQNWSLSSELAWRRSLLETGIGGS